MSTLVDELGVGAGVDGDDVDDDLDDVDEERDVVVDEVFVFRDVIGDCEVISRFGMPIAMVGIMRKRDGS